MEIDQPLLVVAGAALVAFVLVDLVWTTIAVGGGRGPLTNFVARSLAALGRAGRPDHRRLTALGVVVAVAVPTTWLLLTLAGFTLFFLADAEAVVSAATQEPTSAMGRLAYAAGGLAGAGASLVAGTTRWELVNNASAILGLAMATLSITYVLRIVNAVSSERSMASQVAGLGTAPGEVVADACRSTGMGTLRLQLALISSSLTQVAQDHLTLPMLQFFHSSTRSSSVALNVARYDDILSVLEHALPEQHRPTVQSGRAAVDAFLDTIEVPHTSSSSPPPPTLAPLRAVRDDVVDDATFGERIDGEAARRAHLLAYVESEGWGWRDVAP